MRHKERQADYYCKSCKRKFVNNGDFQKLKFSPKTISLTLDLYFKGVSLRKISDHLRQFHNLSVSYGTIHNWLEKYVAILNDYVSTLELDTSSVWHADEMMVNVGGNWKYFWNVIDEGTRFQLASVISEERRIEDAHKVFQVVKQVAQQSGIDALCLVTYDVDREDLSMPYGETYYSYDRDLIGYRGSERG